HHTGLLRMGLHQLQVAGRHHVVEDVDLAGHAANDTASQTSSTHPTRLDAPGHWSPVTGHRFGATMPRSPPIRRSHDCEHDYFRGLACIRTGQPVGDAPRPETP